jgi:tripartite-type tricarboxylate transporter receptor subunit TctC
MPDLPTVAEAGVPGYAAGTWYGVFLPAKTPPAIVDQVSAALKTVLTNEGLKATIAKQGAEAHWMTPGQFAEFVRADSAKWGTLIREVGIKVD